MKSIIVIISILSLLLSGCGRKKDDSAVQNEATEEPSGEVSEFDSESLQAIKDQVYAELNEQLPTDEYLVQDVKVIYLSEDEVDNLSPEDKVYFGFSANGLNDVITSDMAVIEQMDSGEVNVKSEKLLDKEDRTTIIKNLAIGTGIILVCVTVACITQDMEIENELLTAFIALAPKASAIGAGLFTVITGTVSGVVEYVKSKNLKESFRKLIVDGSKGFKWGAVAGVVYAGAKSFLSDFMETHNQKIPEFKESEVDAAKKFKSIKEQVVFCDGVESPKAFAGCSVVDFVTKKNEAFEVKNYDLEHNMPSLLRTLKRQISERVKNLPDDYTQKIVLDVRGRGYSKDFISQRITEIQDALMDIYPHIEVEVIKDGFLPF